MVTLPSKRTSISATALSSLMGGTLSSVYLKGKLLILPEPLAAEADCAAWAEGDGAGGCGAEATVAAFAVAAVGLGCVVCAGCTPGRPRGFSRSGIGIRSSSPITSELGVFKARCVTATTSGRVLCTKIRSHSTPAPSCDCAMLHSESLAGRGIAYRARSVSAGRISTAIVTNG